MTSNSLELLRTMVGIPSVNPFQYFSRPNNAGYIGLGTEENMNLFIETELHAAGFEVTRQLLHPRETTLFDGKHTEIPPRWNVLGVRYPRGTWNGKSILLFGHTDTVDVKLGWRSDPFAIDCREELGQERWYGLGANDMKGGLAAILDAVQSAQTNSYALKVAFVVDEEFYSFGAEALCESEFIKDTVFAIAPEIGDPREAGKDGQELHQRIGIGRTGRIEYDVQIAGSACHGADAFVSTSAVNAVHESAKLQTEFIRYCAGVRRMFSAHDAECVNSAFISHHAGGVPMLSVPFEAGFVLDRTFLPDESPDEELLRLRELISNAQLTGKIDPRTTVTVSPRPRPTSPCKPYLCPMDTPEVQLAIQAARKLSSSASFFIGRSVADENRLATRGIPTLTMGPSGAGSHTCEEWVDPKSVVKLAEIFRDIISSC